MDQVHLCLMWDVDGDQSHLSVHRSQEGAYRSAMSLLKEKVSEKLTLEETLLNDYRETFASLEPIDRLDELALGARRIYYADCIREQERVIRSWQNIRNLMAQEKLAEAINAFNLMDEGCLAIEAEELLP